MTVPPGAIGCGDGEGPLLQRHLLERRCDLLQNDNRRLLHRIYQVRKLTKRYKREIKFLGGRLDVHGDDFRTAGGPEDAEPPAPASASAPRRPNPSAPKSRTPSVKRSAPKRKRVKTEKAEPSGPRAEAPAPLERSRNSTESRRQEGSKRPAPAWKPNDNKKAFF